MAHTPQALRQFDIFHQRLLGEGATKRVYLAHDTTLARDVALALIRTDYLDEHGKERISREARVPVIKHLDGNCHTYVDDPCDLEMALKVVDNAKTQKYSPCNATESLLVAKGVASQFLPRMAQVFASKGVAKFPAHGPVAADPKAAGRLRLAAIGSIFVFVLMALAFYLPLFQMLRGIQ